MTDKMTPGYLIRDHMFRMPEDLRIEWAARGAMVLADDGTDAGTFVANASLGGDGGGGEEVAQHITLMADPVRAFAVSGLLIQVEALLAEVESRQTRSELGVALPGWIWRRIESMRGAYRETCTAFDREVTR